MSIIIDMDMPKRCDDCRLCTYYGNGFGDCRLTGIEMNRNAAKVRHPDCPLQEIGGTNGEVISSLFSDNPIDIFIHDVNIREGLNVVAHFDREWWNAPYKAESEG
jgi:hypothetical protein